MLLKIKLFLAKFWPVTIRRFHREKTEAKSSLQGIRQQMQEQYQLIQTMVESFREENKIYYEQMSEKNKMYYEQICLEVRKQNAIYYEQMCLEVQRQNAIYCEQMYREFSVQNELFSEQIIKKSEELFSDGVQRQESCIEEFYQKSREDFSKLKVCVEKLDSLQKDVREIELYQEQKLPRMFNDVKNAIPNRKVYWNNVFEKEVVRINWGNVMETPDFSTKFSRLTKGLDEESIRTIIQILVRQKKYLESDNDRIDLFTREEQEKIRLLKENFHSEILKVSNDLYAYRQYLLPINQFEASVFYYKHGIDCLATARKVKGKAIIDVGGYIGDSVLILEELNPSQIYTFEAVPHNFELLKRTIELNHLDNVIAENIALSEKEGTCIMHLAGSSTSAIERGGITYTDDIEVSVTTLDQYIEKNHIEVGLIKVDIEGGEPGFLVGAKETICKQKPIILLSIYHNAHDFFELKPLIESWDLGYSFKIHKPVFGSVSGETLLLAEVLDVESD